MASHIIKILSERRRRRVVKRRPYATHYFTSHTDPLPSYSSRGCAATPEGAVRASVFRIFIGQYAKAVIYNRGDGTAVYTVKYGANGLQVQYGHAADRSLLLARKTA